MSNTTALARKFRVDVSTDLTGAGGWTEVKGIYALKPTADPNNVDTSAYDTNGWDSFEITSYAWGLTASFWRRTTSGVYDSGQEILRACVGNFGDTARVAVRFYDKNGGPEAYQGVAIVKWERANDGVKDADAATVTLTGDGARTTITNPGTAAAAPVVTAATPSGVAAAGQVQILGSGFTGTVATTGVKFGGVNATSWVVVSDNVIVAVMPSGSAGSAAVLVTNAVGASNSFAYTRG
jgi:hypothetical protein